MTSSSNKLSYYTDYLLYVTEYNQSIHTMATPLHLQLSSRAMHHVSYHVDTSDCTFVLTVE